MNSFVHIWCGLVCLHLACSRSWDDESVRANVDTLLAVVGVYRHGDRTPIQPYPTDPYGNESWWPVPFGQLTNIGKAQHYRLGKWLRRRYDGFLPAEYSPRDIWVRATDVDRTLMSAEANLAGLYPPHGDQQWMPNIHWQPIPIHTMPEHEDNVLAMKRPCAQYEIMLDELLHLSEPFITIQRQNRDLYDYLTRHSGRTINDLTTLEYLYNNLYIERLYNLTLPAWAKAVFPDKLKRWAELSFRVPCYTPALTRLKTGPLFDTILSFFQQRAISTTSSAAGETIIASNSSSEPKFLMFSAHDTTIANVLNTLGAFDPPHTPDYASTILMELHRSATEPDKYEIRIMFRNSTVELMPIKAASTCLPDYCDFDTFLDAMAPIRIALPQWMRECAGIKSASLNSSDNRGRRWWWWRRWLSADGWPSSCPNNDANAIDQPCSFYPAAVVVAVALVLLLVLLLVVCILLISIRWYQYAPIDALYGTINKNGGGGGGGGGNRPTKSSNGYAPIPSDDIC